MICPYFIDTPLLNVAARLALAGGATGKPEDVVDAATRLMADTRIVGRALVVGPKVRRDDDWQLLPSSSTEGHESAVWEAYAEDFTEVGKSVCKLKIQELEVFALTMYRGLYSKVC
jgi:hypothetical protein